MKKNLIGLAPPQVLTAFSIPCDFSRTQDAATGNWQQSGHRHDEQPRSLRMGPAGISVALGLYSIPGNHGSPECHVPVFLQPWLILRL